MVRVIGLMSGTSVDGIDAALVGISGVERDLQVQLLAADTYPYPTSLREQILAVCHGSVLSMTELAALDDAIAQEFAQAALAIQVGNTPVDLIGSHGQTVYHRPPRKEEGRGQKAEGGRKPLPSALQMGYSLQLGRGAVIAQISHVSTVSNFRAADIAAGGQGAPLVSRVDACLLSHPTRSRCVQNIGGMGNLTYLPSRENSDLLGAGIKGWDTGPGNVLLDLAVQQLSNGRQTYDRDGAWAAAGTPCQELLNQWLQHEFFQQPPPKSTGRELFSQAYLQTCLIDAEPYNLSPADLLATLTELTATSIALNYRNFLPQMPDEVLLCGGGSRNAYLRQCLQAHLDSVSVLTTDEVGLSSDFKEAIAFAVLAYWRQRGIPGNLPTVTGARQAMPLGEIYTISWIA